MGGGALGAPSHLMTFFETPSSKLMPPPWGAPPSKNKAPFQKETQKKSETVINTCVSLTKHWKKMTEIPKKT